MPVQRLIRGANTSLTEIMPVQGTVVVGFGWKLTASRAPSVELVPAAIICGPSGTAITDDHMIFFNQLLSPDGAVTYVDGDEEQIEVDFAQIPADVEKIVFVVYADPDLRQAGHFGAVRGAYVRICDQSGDELVRYDVEKPSDMDVTAMVFAEIYRHRGGWKMRAVGQGYATGLKGVASDFGVAI